MITKSHKQNTNFQIAYFLLGSCHTPDAAYSLAKDLREERQTAVDNYAVSQLKVKARVIRANKLLLSDDEADKLEGLAELLELNNNKKTGEILYKVACDEIIFIDKCIEILQPFRKFKRLSDSEANEAAQYEEWKLELLYRAENMMITNGGIPTDQFATMRMHPAFQKDILPRINEMQVLMKTKEGVEKLQKQIGGSKFKEINKLIAIT